MSTRPEVLARPGPTEPMSVDRARELLAEGGYPTEGLTDADVEELMRAADELISFALSIPEEATLA